MGRHVSWSGRHFRFRWCRCLARDFLDTLSSKPYPAIHVRPKDQFKFRILQSQASLFLTGHFHNWEALAAWMGQQGVPLLGAARPLQSPLFNSLLSRLRKKSGVSVVTHNILPRALSHLHSGRCFGILWDQYSKLHRHSTLLFGIPAAMDPLPEVLVRRCRPAVMAGFLLPDGMLRLVSLLPSGTALPDPALLSRRYHRVLETVVRAYPTHWYGLCHARFKDTVSYPGGRIVSRETSRQKPRAKIHVSRETKVFKPSRISQG
jgi:lauroyl/myristoyl acyltransferase